MLLTKPEFLPAHLSEANPRFTRPDIVEQPLYVIIATFNPERSRNLMRHPINFTEYFINAGAIVYHIEGSFGDRNEVYKETISDKHVILHLRTTSQIWLKENLQNIAMTFLPPDAEYIACIDPDVKFIRDDIVGETIQQLQHFDIVQMFRAAWDVNKDSEIFSLSYGFVHDWMAGIDPKKTDGYYYFHGGKFNRFHTGYAWAYRRSALDALGGLIDIGILGCYDDQTEICTGRGFIPFSELSMEDVVLSRTLDGRVEWGLVTKLYKDHYDGDMYQIKSSSLDLMVTPNHNMLYVKPDSDECYFEKMENVGNQRIIPKQSLWDVPEPEYFELYGASSIDNFVAFMGIWLAEGWVYFATDKINRGHHYRIGIAQSKPENHEVIKTLLDETFPGIKWSYTRKNGEINGIMGNSKELFTYLQQFGKSLDKFIPVEIKELPKHYIETFMKWFILGDGSIEKGKKEGHKDMVRVYTSSTELRDDLLEMIVKTGAWASYNSHIQDSQPLEDGRIIYQKAPNHRINIHSSKNFYLDREAISIVPYNGMIYCCETPHHTLLVRRNNKMIWCGNSGDNHMAKCLIGEWEKSVNMGVTQDYKDVLIVWQDRALKYIKKNIGYVKGDLIHKWHGAKSTRGYRSRWQILVDEKFSPKTDIKKDINGCWQLVTESARQIELKAKIREYFRSRDDDGTDMKGIQPFWLT